VLALTAVTLSSPGVAEAGESGGITVEATVNDRPVDGATANDPIRLVPDEPTTIGLTVSNDGDDELQVERVRLAGTSLGLTLIAYDIPVPLRVPPGEDRDIDIPLVLFDLERQATGLVPGTVSIYDDSGTIVADQTFTLDVRGSATSVVGLFGVVILIATVLSVVTISRHIATRTLPANRFKRGIRFGLTGVGIGLTFVIALAAFRVVAPEGAIWGPFALIPGIAGFLLGFISPGVLSIEEDEIDQAQRALARQTAAGVTPEPEAQTATS
jgi:hypothetical protein